MKIGITEIFVIFAVMLKVLVPVLFFAAIIFVIKHKIPASPKPSVYNTTLGQSIKAHREQCHMTQEYVAHSLSVSRQAVSKWENNSAVPDLEKIVKISEIFEISLDELVKGTKTEKQDNVQIIKEVIIQEPQREGRKTAGIILFCMAFLVFLLLLILTRSIGGLLYAVPFIVCGIICFAFKEHTGLWCAWAVLLMFDAFMRIAMGISIGMIRHTLIWSADMNYARLAIAWIFLAVNLLLVVITILIFRKKELKITHFTNKHLFFGWTGWIVAIVLHQVILRTQFYFNLISYMISIPMVYNLYSMILEWIQAEWLIAMIIYTLRVNNAKKTQNEVPLS